ncbi:hypothetical protein, partial [Helicobacter pylori]
YKLIDIRLDGDIEIFAQIDNENQKINRVNYNHYNSGFVPITQNEALYILEKLLDKDNQEIILKSQDSRSISSRLPIKIPLYKNR